MESVTPWSSVGWLTYKRTYSRQLGNENNAIGWDTTDVLEKSVDGLEDWPDTIDRVIESCDKQLNCGFTPEEEEALRQYHLQLKGSVAGRFLWQLGTHTVTRLGLASLQNCAGTVVDHPVRPFCWAMDMLALGSGVGFSIERKYVSKLPPVKPWFKAPTEVEDFGADFIIPDSREGWVKFLGKVLKAAFLSENEVAGTFTFCTKAVRGKGEPIKGFGGKASGPQDLVKGIGQISHILMKRRGKKISSVDALDIMNIIAQIIVAGNVRRSAQIAIGDPDDIEYLLAKRWDIGNIPSWRGMSNNSVNVSDITNLPDIFWDGYRGKGEPYGLVNIDLAQTCGRTGDYRYPDPTAVVFNPCAEQPLALYESCCLADIFLPNIRSLGELIEVITLLYRVNKHSLRLPCHHKETEDIVHKNMRMGIGISGVCMASEAQLEWLPEAYEYLREYDIQYSAKHGWPTSVKLTTIKPSGTLSLLPGVTPGVHPGYASFMIRRISVATDHPLASVARANGYDVEFLRRIDSSLDHNTSVIAFPFKYMGDNVIYTKDMTAIRQLDLVRRMQKEWSDNAVSCTVYYRPEELEEIIEYLKKYYNDSFKSLSFLLHSDHGFEQAPFEEISEERYNEMISKVKPITSLEKALDFDDSNECAGGVCPVR